MIRRNVTFRAPSAVLLLAVSLAAFAALCVLQRAPMADALVYRAEGAAVARGGDLYGFTVTEWQLPATYPPFAAILFVPLAWLPTAALKVTFLVGNAALLFLLVRLSCRFAGMSATAPVVCVATACALWLEPVFQTLLFGQINLALVCLILWDLGRPPGVRGRGIALGIAAGVKLTPALFVVHLLLSGWTRYRAGDVREGRERVRAGLTALASCGATVLVGALALPAASLDFWTRRLFETGRVGKAWLVDNQSLQGLVARALGDPSPGLAWALPAVAAGCAGLWVACRTPDARRGVLATAFTALLVSPISWSHHWVWCVPLLAVLLAQGRTGVAALTAVVFTARTLWLVPHQGDLDLRLPWWQQVLASPYVLLVLALLLSARVPVRRAPVPAGHPDHGPAALSPLREAGCPRRRRSAA